MGAQLARYNAEVQADAELGVALDKLSTIILTKENIITDFEQREFTDE